MANPFSIAVDTGGTFTDSIAVDPNGQILTCKILSNSTLRGSVIEWTNQKTFRIEHSWDIKRDILQGYIFQIMEKGPLSMEGIFSTKKYDFANKIIELNKELPIELLNQNKLSVLTQHRKVAPFGLNGEKNGQCGKQYLILKNEKNKP